MRENCYVTVKLQRRVSPKQRLVYNSNEPLLMRQLEEWGWMSDDANKSLQADLRGTAGSVPHRPLQQSECRNRVSRNLFAGRRCCLQFVKNAISLKHNKTKYACTEL